MRKIGCILLALLMCASVLTGCGNSENSVASGPSSNTPNTSSDSASSTASGEAAAEPEKIVFAFFTNIDTPPDMGIVEEAINKLTVEKINVEVELLPISLGTYEQQINLMISGNEKLDLFTLLGSSFASTLNQKKIVSIDADLMNEDYVQEIFDVLGETYMSSVNVSGEIYGIPVLKDMASNRGINYDHAIAEEAGFDLEYLTSGTPEDLIPLFEAVQAVHPDMTMTSSQDSGQTVMDSIFCNYDLMIDRFGVLLNYGQDDLNLVNLYESNWYADTLKTIRQWYLDGYILKDNSINPDVGITLFKSGKQFSYGGDMHIATYTVVANMTGKDVADYTTTKPFSSNASITGVLNLIPATCENQEPVLKFLNLLYTDPDLINLFDWGIEGLHYERVEGSENRIRYPEGVDANNTGYGLELGWEFGNQMLSYVWETNPDDYYEHLKEFNESALMSKAIGFVFDSSSVSTEIAALNNVLNEYRFGLENGEMDPDVYLPIFQQALRDAGIEKVIAEKQAQLDAWAAANGK